MKRITALVLGILLFANLTSKADEGMWLLDLVQKIYPQMKANGCELTAEQIYSINHSSLKDAVVQFGGGCTAEMVSKEGLLLTNHHCGYQSIQYLSSVEHDFLKYGFWAKNRGEELTVPFLTVTFLVRLEDVTAEATKGVSAKTTEADRLKQIEKNAKAIETKTTAGNHYSASVRSIFGGNKYYLFVYETFKDVRLVGTPPDAIGKFGGDTDNWMWPRHTGDFSVFRVYSAPDGSPAAYSASNVPLKPKHYLPVSVKGVKKDDFTMVLGFPGRTTRYMTSYEVDNVMSITNANRVKIRGIRQEILQKDMQSDDKIRIQYAAKYAQSSNYWKYSIGQNKGLARLNVKAKKEELEARFLQWIDADAKRKATYGEALPLIKDACSNVKEYMKSSQYISECLLNGTEVVGFASRFSDLYTKMQALGRATKLSNQAKAPAKEIKAAQEDVLRLQKEVDSVANVLKRAIPTFYKNLNPPTDQKAGSALFALFYKDVKPEFQPSVFAEIAPKYNSNFGAFMDDLYRTSVFADPNKLNAFLAKPDTATLANDLAFKAGYSSYNKLMEVRSKSEAITNNLAKGQRQFIAGIMEMQPDKAFAPDANSTMRLTYGKVGGYAPADAVAYDYTTTLKGIMEKEDPNNFEFVVPEKLKELYKNKDYGRYSKDGNLVVCFTANNDITGGNSGSPVLNGKGELIGLAFDGNWEAMSGDVAFEPELQKTIVVDARYVLFIIEKFGGAKHLVDEMTVME